MTQSDLDSMSNQTAVAPVQRAPVSQATAFTTEPAPSSTPTAYATGDATYTDPAGTLEGQANRLAAGSAPVQSLAQAQPTPVQQTAAAAETIQNQPSVASLPKASAAASGSIRFLPIIGAPVQAITPLSKQLGAEARAHGLTIKSSTDASSEHILKGYFSTLKDGDKTTVVYVWDVLDGSGNRLHRIQGQESVPGGGADLWSGVPATTMQGSRQKPSTPTSNGGNPRPVDTKFLEYWPSRRSIPLAFKFSLAKKRPISSERRPSAKNVRDWNGSRNLRGTHRSRKSAGR